MLVRTAVFIVWVSAVSTDAVDVPRDDQGEDLLPSPERARLEDGRLGHFAIPGGKEHQQVHHLTLIESKRGRGDRRLRGSDSRGGKCIPHSSQFSN